MISFSTNAKNEISNIQFKTKKCCLFALIYGYFFCSRNEGNKNIIRTSNENVAKLFINLCDHLFKKKHLCYYKSNHIYIDLDIIRYFTIEEYQKHIFKCEECRHFFLKGVFLSSGSVSDPEKSYLLEISMNSPDSKKQLLSFLTDMGLPFKERERSGKYIIYSKTSEVIEDFLARVGANNATFAIMNSKIIKEFLNNTNRVYNCDNANISKSLAASEKYISAINYLIETNKIDRLPDQLKETAYKRIEFKELNYTELGKKFNPVISKSGLFHRLEKIVELCEDYRKED